MKQVIQLDADGYFVGTTMADESPLESGLLLMPAHTIDIPLSELPAWGSHQRLRWNGGWVVEDVPVESVVEPPIVVDIAQQPVLDVPVNDTPQWYIDRVKNYPDIAIYVDGIVKGDQVQIDAYIATCLAVKAKYPKPADEVAPLDSDA